MAPLGSIVTTRGGLATLHGPGQLDGQFIELTLPLILFDGPLIWAVIAEIFPNAMRGRAVGLCVFLLWLANFLVSQFFPYLLERFEAATFWIYGVFGIAIIVLIAFRLHETKGKTLEAITSEELETD